MFSAALHLSYQVALKLHKLTTINLSHKTYKSGQTFPFHQSKSALTPLSNARCSRTLPYCDSAKSCAKCTSVFSHCHQELSPVFMSFLYIHSSGGKKTKNKQPKTKQQQKNSLKIGEPRKTSQEITQICLEVYNLNFDMTIINQFSQLCSRLAHEKDIILLDCFRLNQHTIAKPGFACGESYYRYFAKYTITPFS